MASDPAYSSSSAACVGGCSEGRAPTYSPPPPAAVPLQEKGSGILSWISNFLWSCIAMTAVLYIMTMGAATMRRLQGGAAAMPGGGASVAAATGNSSQGMFGNKEYSKARREGGLVVRNGWVGECIMASLNMCM